MRQRPDGITGLLATGQLDAMGVTTRVLVRDQNFTQRSGETSCSMSAIGNRGARSSGPTGSLVPGCSGGAGSARSRGRYSSPTWRG